MDIRKEIQKYVNLTRFWQLISGIIGIYISYYFYFKLFLEISQEKYRNPQAAGKEQEYSNFQYTTGMIAFPALMTSLVGTFISKFKYPKDSITVPDKQAEMCGIATIFAGVACSLAFENKTQGIMYFSEILKACNILFIILVGVFFSKVSSPKLKLDKYKLIVGLLISIALIFYLYASNPAFSYKPLTKKDFIAVLLLIIGTISAAVLPDLQQAIKAKHQPSANQLMTSINVWVAVVGFAYYTVTTEIYDVLVFLYNHENIKFDLFYISLAYAIGQIFVYRMITQFKQHFYPIVFAFKDIFVFIFFSKSSDEAYALQVVIILFLIGVAGFEFFQELKHEESEELPQESSRNNEMAQLKQSPHFEKIPDEDISKPNNKREDNKQYGTIEDKGENKDEFKGETVLNNEKEINLMN